MSINSSPVGLTVRCHQKPCPECGSIDSAIGNGDDQHHGEMVCIVCDRHSGWISKKTHDFIVGIIRHMGRPTEPILLKIAKRDQTNSCVRTNKQQQPLSQPHSKGVANGL